jgi:acetate kinase
MGAGESGHVLCLNAGSGTLKLALYSMARSRAEKIAAGAVERVGLDAGQLWMKNGAGETLTNAKGEFPSHQAAVAEVLRQADALALPRPAGIGHRVVHGGAAHESPAVVDSALLADLRDLIPFAPLHLPGELETIEAAAKHFSGVPQVACFDTAFHRTMPERAQRFPLPRRLWEEGVRRYGFHGLSYRYILGALGEAARGRVIVAHLGNGASMAAVSGGQPLDTTMGFSPTGGFMMGTRSGDLDPGVLLYLLREKGYDIAAVDRLVNHEAGLLGVSAASPDMKTLLDRRESDPRAAQAVEMFCYQVRKQIGAYAAALGGVDTLVFTGGIGERAAPVRALACSGLEHLGIRLDPDANASHADTISFPAGGCTVRVIPTNEELVIARETWKLLRGSG